MTGRGFITFTFAIDNIAKCMKETAPPGQKRKGAGKVSIPRAGFARRRGHRERMGSGHHPHTEWLLPGLRPGRLSARSCEP